MTTTDPTSLPIFNGSRGEERTARGTVQVPRRAGAHALAGQINPTPHHAPAATPPSLPPVPGPGPSEGHVVLDLPAPTTAGAQRASLDGVDWKKVAELRAQASNQLGAALGQEPVDRETEREIGRSIIQELVATESSEAMYGGGTGWSQDEQFALAQAVFDALFGLGRLQPLVDDDSVENIIIAGYDNVWLEKTDGALVQIEPIADSDEQLTDDLAFIASRSEVNARPFSSANPRLHMRLDGGSRLAAAAWVTARPSVVIRRHRLRRVSLQDLVGRAMLSPLQASFLRAAVQARKSIVVAGPQGGGKTTLVRALCQAINPWEKIGTFETEFELHLHELPDVHQIVHAWEARPGSGEIGADGKQAGEFSLDEALYDSFRFSLDRQIVGEVRGREIWAMIKAMESGAGSISTTHAASAEGAVRKLVTCAMEAGSHITRDLATSKLAETVDIIVQVHLETEPQRDGTWKRSRWVSEIVHVAPGEKVKGYSTTNVFLPNPAGGPGVPGTLPDELRALEAYGFDLNGYLMADGQTEKAR